MFLSLSEWGGTANGWPSMELPARELWVHHSTTLVTGDAVADFLVLDRIGRSQGNGGVAYSYVIEDDVIGEGQGTRRGAHTGGTVGGPWGHNPYAFGVCVVGNYEESVPSSASLRSIQYLRDRLLSDGTLAPGVYPTGGHRDASGNSTACPGDNLEHALGALRLPYTNGDDMTPEESSRLGRIEAILAGDHAGGAYGYPDADSLGQRLSEVWAHVQGFPAFGVVALADEIVAKLGSPTGGPSVEQIREAVRDVVRSELDATKLAPR